MKENTIVPPPSGTDKLYFPSASVVVPLVVPFTRTFTPGREIPSSADVTLPETVRVCAHTMLVKSISKNTIRNRKSFLIQFSLSLENY